MKKLLAAATTAAALFSTPVKAELDTYSMVVLTNAVYLCNVTEGLMQAKQAADGAYDYLLTEYELEPFQVRNLTAAPGFWDQVSEKQRELGGCRKIVRDIKQSPVFKELYR